LLLYAFGRPIPEIAARPQCFRDEIRDRARPALRNAHRPVISRAFNPANPKVASPGDGLLRESQCSQLFSRAGHAGGTIAAVSV
jgi:hypothetical protein